MELQKNDFLVDQIIKDCGKGMASIKDVAKKAGVSISTVSNVINDTKYVSDELKLKINKVITELNYEVDPVARSLKSKKTLSIGVIITNINRIFFHRLLREYRILQQRMDIILLFAILIIVSKQSVN